MYCASYAAVRLNSMIMNKVCAPQKKKEAANNGIVDVTRQNTIEPEGTVLEIPWNYPKVVTWCWSCCDVYEDKPRDACVTRKHNLFSETYA